MEMVILVNLQSGRLIILEKACITLSMGASFFNPKNWWMSTFLGKSSKSSRKSVPKSNHLDTCYPGLGTWCSKW